MANLLVYIELKDSQATRASLSTLNAGRAVATGLGGTLYALLPCTSPPSYGHDDIIAVLARHGADKVILVTGPELEVPLHATHGEAVRTACMQLRPRLVLMPATAPGRDIAPRLAMQIGARYLADMELRHGDDDFQLSGTTFRRRFRTTESLRGAGAPLVVTLLASSAPRALGDDEAEVIILQSPAPEPTGPKVEGRRGTPRHGDLATARLVIAGGAGLGPEATFVELERLAGALGGAAVASPTVHEGNPGGITLPTPGCVSAEVYLAIAVSGSDRHLASVPPSTRVIAVNTDPNAPIMQVADQALIADGSETVTAMLAELEPSEKE